MKSLIRNIRTVAALAAVLAIPHPASAAVKTWQTLAATPATTNITAGMATNLTATITFRNGSGASARYVGAALLTATLSPAEPSITVGLSQSTFTFPSTDTTFSPTLTFTTTSLTPSNSYVVMLVGTTNPPVPTPPPTGYLPITNYFTVTMTPPFNPVKVWSPAGVNTNWSTAGNWSPSGAPGSSNDVKFFDAGAVGTAGTTNNVVDTSSNVGSLTYGQTNNYHTTLIPSGATLTLSGTNGLAVGTGTDNGDFQLTTAAITGAGGTLTVNNSSASVNVGQPHPTSNNGVSSAQATLDLSGLDTFTASVSRVLVGCDLSIKGSSGVLNLARTNRIAAAGSTAPQIDIGDNTQAGGAPTIASMLLLGQTNTILADSIAVGRGKTDLNGASLHFNGSFTSPVAYFRGASGGASRVASWSIGDGATARTYWTYGTNDFSLGTVDARVDSMVIGRGAVASSPNPGNGFLIFNAGTIDVNTLSVGYSQDGVGTGTVNANGGSLLVNTSLELAHGASAVGTLNISSATVTANAGIIAGGGAATINLSSSGTLNVANSAATIGTAGSPLTTLSMNNSTLKVAAQSLTPAVTTANLSAGGTVNTIDISAVPLLMSLPAQFPVISYTTPSGDLATFALGTLPSGSPAYQGYISNNTANSSIDLVLTNGPVFYPLVWVGSPNGNWDINGTANWKSNGIAAKYQQNYLVVQFDDTLTGSSTVNLTTTLTPGSVIVNNSLSNYTFNGTGKLSQSASLTKSGTGTLTLAESGGNDFTNGVTVTGGTLQVGNGSTTGTLPAGNVSVAASAALKFDRSDSVAVGSVISGLGTLEQSGAGMVTLNGTNAAFSGMIIVAQGTLAAGNAAALGTASATVTVSNAATLDVNGQVFNNAQPVTALGAGVGGNGAIVNNSVNNATKALRTVTLTGNTTFGGYSDWDIHSSANGTSDASLSGASLYKLTKTGTNTVTLFGAQVDSNLGDVDVLTGALSFERNTTSMGDTTKTLTVFTNATLQFGNASNVWDKVVVLKDGATLRAIQRAEFAGSVTLESGVGTVVANTAGAQLILDAAVGGAGGLTKNGVGALDPHQRQHLCRTHAGDPGTLALINSGSIDSSTNITLSAGTTLDLSALATPTLTLTAGRGLKGSGTVVGNVTMASGSTLTVGGPGTNTIGTLTVTNDLVLQAGSTNLMEVGKVGATKVNDQVVATNVTYGGTLTVMGAGGALVAGDIFKLFSAGSYGSSFGTINLPVGTTWDTSKLTVDGTIKVLSVVSPQVTGVTPTNGNFQLSFSGPGGNSYSVWASTNVAATPIATTWTPLVTNGLFGVAGTATFVDTSATNYPARFYLISVP